MDEKLILKIFRCDKCQKPLRKAKTGWECSNHHFYRETNGIIICNEKYDDFYEGKFTVQYNKPNFRNPFYALLYIIWFSISLGARHFRSFARLLKSYRKKGLILDFGCGGGNKSYLSAGRVIGVDLSLSSLKNAKKIYSGTVLSDGHKLPFEDNTFDYVFSSQVFGHIPHDEKDIIIKELYRVSKPGGILFVTIECDSKGNPIVNFMKKYPELYRRYWLDMYGHYGLELPSENIKRFEKNGFQVKKVENGLRLIWEANGYYEILKGFANVSPSAKIFCLLIKPIATIFPLRMIWDIIGGVISKLFEWSLPLDWSTGVIITAKVNKDRT